MTDHLASGRIELRHLRAIVAVADELHFGRAATRLHLAQPALTKQIQQLEEALGVELIDRSRRAIALTPPGAVMAEEARRTLAQADHAAESAIRSGRGEIGTLRVGFSASAPNGVFPHVIRAFRQRHPEVRLVLKELWSSDQSEALLQDRLDVGFANPPAIDSPAIASEVLQQDRTIVAVHAGSRFARRAAIELSELAEEPFIAFPRATAPGRFDELIAACREAGFSPRIVQEVMELTATLGFVAAGLGCALLPATTRSLARDGVRYVELLGATPITPTVVAWRRDDDAAVLQRFIAVARLERLSPIAADA